MKKNLVSIIVVVALFAALSVFALGSKKNDSNVTANGKDAASAVKICPNTGLPCTGDGDCDDECEEEEVIQPVATSPESVEE